MSTITTQSNNTVMKLGLALQLEITRVIHHALAEDLGISPEAVAKLAGSRTMTEFDLTTTSIVGPAAAATADFVVKQPGVIAGLPIAKQVFETIDPSIQFEIFFEEGSVISQIPTTIARVSGSASTILVAERTALNILQRLCGIATATKQYTDKLTPAGITVLDTRKTTPGMRLLEKYAVHTAGGTNHRIGLFDAVLIKDNHIGIAGSITNAVQKVRAKYRGRPVEVEVTNEAELREALECGAEKILLDNMDPVQIHQSIQIVAGRCFIEVSGGINLSNIDKYLIKGVNAISVGALTHSVRSLDISLEIEA